MSAAAGGRAAAAGVSRKWYFSSGGVLSQMAAGLVSDCRSILVGLERANGGFLRAGGEEMRLKMIQSNKEWKWRLDVVDSMEKWVKEHLTKRGEFDRCDRSDAQKEAKAKEYLYGYLFWGRRQYPDSKDPLFFHDSGASRDRSLENQMTPGAYMEFLVEFAKQMQPPDTFGDEVQYADVESYLGDSRGAFNTCIAALELDDGCKEQAKIGLILRYRCVGGFDSNLHGSLPEAWSKSLSNFVECFASPLNHKFKAFHSMFEEDNIFGGKGDFFKYLSDNSGILPPGNYEINPPFHVELINQVAEAIKYSFESAETNNSPLRIVCIVPDWPGAEFIYILDSVASILGENAMVFRKRYAYSHSNGNPLRVNTIFYVLSSSGVVQDARNSFFFKCMGLIDPCHR